jgi:hypothetical protein
MTVTPLIDKRTLQLAIGAKAVRSADPGVSLALGKRRPLIRLLANT